MGLVYDTRNALRLFSLKQGYVSVVAVGGGVSAGRRRRLVGAARLGQQQRHRVSRPALLAGQRRVVLQTLQKS